MSPLNLPLKPIRKPRSMVEPWGWDAGGVGATDPCEPETWAQVVSSAAGPRIVPWVARRKRRGIRQTWAWYPDLPPPHPPAHLLKIAGPSSPPPCRLKMEIVPCEVALRTAWERKPLHYKRRTSSLPKGPLHKDKTRRPIKVTRIQHRFGNQCAMIANPASVGSRLILAGSLQASHPAHLPQWTGWAVLRTSLIFCLKCPNEIESCCHSESRLPWRQRSKATRRIITIISLESHPLAPTPPLPPTLISGSQHSSRKLRPFTISTLSPRDGGRGQPSIGC